MKKGLVFLAFILITLFVVISFELQPRGTQSIHNIPKAQEGIALYICPAEDSVFYSISEGIKPLSKYKNILMIFILMFALGSLIYALYTSFLKDEFKRELYNTPFGLLIVLFWFIITTNIIFYAPNSYRQVWYTGEDSEIVNQETPYVLCEKTDRNSIAVGYKAISNIKFMKAQ